VPLIKQIRRSRVDPRCAYLRESRANVTSQCGEDGVIARIFATIGVVNKWCVEFGAWDGRHCSNTYNLVANNGWNGVLIEGDASKFPDLRRTYHGNPRAHLIHARVGFDEEPGSLESILGETEIPANFDLLSIDIDGNDYYIWQGLRKYHPRVVVIEFNPTVPNDVIFVQDRDFEVNQGCSLLALIHLGKHLGYELVCATDWNALFVTAPEFKAFGIKDNSIDAMYDSYYDGRVFQCYDGTVFTVGMNTMIWHGGEPVASDALQLLSPERRVFGGALPGRPKD